MHLNKMDTKKYWKLLDKFSPRQEYKGNNINGIQWVNHFKSLFNDSNSNEIPYTTDRGHLDYEITAEELMDSSSILKAGKAPGLDNVLNEMISSSLNYYPCIFLFLFNHILKGGGDIPDWALSLLVPIYKKGDPCDPANYRGISLISCITKLFLNILNKRLLNYCIQNKILAPNQLGFLPGNRTSDAHIILYNLIDKYCHKGKSNLYTFFVDFSKAFDSLPREILFRKLVGYGITGKFLNIILNLYKNDKICIKINDKMSHKIQVNKSVRQGCVLKPVTL